MQDSNVLNVLIVDDSAKIRKALSTLVAAELNPSQVTTAENGVKALEKISRKTFDLILLDLSMPEMDGFTFLRLLRSRCATPVLVVSAMNDILYVDRALEMGANAFMSKPGDLERNEQSIKAEFRAKTAKLLPREVLLRNFARLETETAPSLMEMRGKPLKSGDFPVVAIGCSSGGPPTLQYLLSGLPKEMKAAIVIAQHMPKGFTYGMVERLKRMMQLPIREASGGDEVVPGEIYFCPGGINMRIDNLGGRPLFVANQPKDKELTPNVDLLFETAADTFGKRLMGIVLTGMGRDGSEGVKRIKSQGGTVLAESDATATIYGMPREAALTGCVDTVLPLPQISVELIRAVSSYDLI